MGILNIFSAGNKAMLLPSTYTHRSHFTLSFSAHCHHLRQSLTKNN